MRIVVYGAGAVGAFFGALLVRAGQDVHFVARGEQLEAIRTRGIRIRSTIFESFDLPPVSAVARAADVGTSDVVLVCVKAHQIDGILDDLASVVGEGTVIVPLQNGVESDEILAGRFGRRLVVPAVVYVGATLEEPGIVSHAAAARIGVGTRAGVDARSVTIAHDVLRATGQPVEIRDDIQRDRWRKLLWNAGFNTVTAVAQRTPYELLRMPETRALVIGIMREAAAVAQAEGVDIRPSDIDEHIAWTERAPGIRTSTMVDRERGRQMETDALLGVVVRKGRALDVATPLSSAVHALMIALDAPAA